MRTLLIRLRTALVRLGFAIGRRRPIRPHVVLATAHASQVGGNLRYIGDELARRTPPIPAVVLASRATPGIRGKLAGMVQALRAGYHLATARLFVVDDYFFPMYVIRPRRGTARVQTWHAAGAFKKIGYSVLDKSFGADEALVSRVAIHSNYDLCLMPSAAATVHYMEAFRQPRERFSSALGLPRTDLFFDPAHRTRAEAAIRARYDLPAGRRVLLYAPTFRGDTMHAARYDDSLDLGVMRRALGDEWVVLLRLHPFVRRAVEIGPELAPFVRDVSDWPDMNELMFVADLLVTDYSSAIFEYALLARPMAFLAPDADAYERERGFYLDFRRDMPGPIFETTEALAAWIAAGDLDPARSVAFARESFDVADGHASERFVDRVVVPALRTGRIDVAGLAKAPDAVDGSKRSEPAR
ncbi:MAG TPA: CDP-glycerol glycerophosphotransferase family protein [Candidatus Limnocylindrales bacterium]|nr:CDP-glycerol glycerophosphotransferase family protein [Candidatus Limnocylindrales bacterium]